MHLYELTQNYLQVLEMAENGGDGFEDTLDSLNDAIDMLQMVKGLGMIDDFCDMVVNELPLEGSLTVAEGQALSDPEIRVKIVEKLEARGVICWETARSV